jgi:3alpha(or 20beta)-hydroxysteroid dehydrogenase
VNDLGGHMGRLDDRVAIVTGGARGTGEAIVRRFVAEGAKVLVLDLLEERGETLAAGLGDAVAFRRTDVTSEADWSDAAADALERWGRLDVLVNNAAILHLCPIDRTELVDFERVLRVNAVGPFLGIKACLPALRDGGGSIVNVGSTDSISGVPTTGAYTTSKFALRGLTKVVALEEGKHGVRCNIVCPGGGNPEMVTEFFARNPGALRPGVGAAERAVEPKPIARRADLSELAGAVLYFASDDSTFCTGTELVVDGGLHAGMYVDVPGMFSTT